jgi:uncharacterized BrkB/YihY/UPF0761 family membrane protein
LVYGILVTEMYETNNYNEGVLYNTIYKTYGRSYNVPKKTIISLYTIIAIVVPVIVPLPLVVVLQKIIPERIRK